jgi:hypothetical protein
MCYLCLQKKYSPGQTDIEQNWAAPEVTLVQKLFFSISEIASTIQPSSTGCGNRSIVDAIVVYGHISNKERMCINFPANLHLHHCSNKVILLVDFHFGDIIVKRAILQCFLVRCPFKQIFPFIVGFLNSFQYLCGRDRVI